MRLLVHVVCNEEATPLVDCLSVSLFISHTGVLLNASICIHKRLAANLSW